MAFEQTHRLMRHYADLLNMHDGGNRQIPESLDDWIERMVKFARAKRGPKRTYFCRLSNTWERL